MIATRRFLIWGLAVLPGMLIAPAYAQSDSFKFSHIDINKAPQALFERGFRPVWIKGGADLTLHGEDESSDTLHLKCDEVTFEYGEDDQFSNIVLKDNVYVDNGEMKIWAALGTLDFIRRKVTFTGNARAEIEGTKLNFQSVEYDLATGRILTRDGQVKDWKIPQGGMGTPKKPTDPSLIATSDISDSAAFVTAIREETLAEAASPGKHIFSMLSDQVRSTLANTPPDQVPADVLAKQLNALLQRPEFYNEEAWATVNITAETAASLAEDGRTLSTEDLTKRNRALLQAAYPDYIAQ
jgi:hypothetical protein